MLQLLRSSINAIAKRILFSWIKTSIVSDELPETEDLRTRALVYVIDTRAWSSVLILDQICELLKLPPPLAVINSDTFNQWHSIYTTSPRDPVKEWILNKPEKRSRMIRGIVETGLEQNCDLYFITVSIFFGRTVQKQKHWFYTLFADTWGFAGRTRRFFTILFHGKDTLIKFSQPVSLLELIDSEQTVDTNIDNVQKHLEKMLYDYKLATLGPDTSQRRTLVKDLLSDKSVQSAIMKRSVEDNITLRHASKQATRYIHEIVADTSQTTISFLERLLRWFWNKFYSGIQVNHTDDLKKLALTHELIYVPCHRSHIDYLLLSYVIHFEGLVIPYIAAGKNLDMPLIGKILRGAGAFFIRRTFRGNELYSTILFEYLALLQLRNMPVEYFIEGGRSRTGRLLSPKPGMLSMSIRAYLKSGVKPIAFIPVYIGYEKMIEGRSYLNEIKGRKKQNETLIVSLKSMLGIKGEYGKVTANFAKPVYLADMLDQCHPGWEDWHFDNANRPKWLRDCVSSTSRRIMMNINQAADINGTNLVALAMHTLGSRNVSENQLTQSIAFYQNLLKTTINHQRTTFTDMSPSQIIEHTVALELINRDEQEGIYSCSTGQTCLLNYYRNNVLHFVVLPSLLANCFNDNQINTLKDIQYKTGCAWPFFASELFLSEHNLANDLSSMLELFTEQKLIEKRGDGFYAAVVDNENDNNLESIAKLLTPLLSGYYIVIYQALKHNAKVYSKEQLIKLCLQSSRAYLETNDAISPDLLDKHLYANFINRLSQEGFIVEVENELHFNQDYPLLDKKIRTLIPINVRTEIVNAIRNIEFNVY